MSPDRSTPKPKSFHRTIPVGGDPPPTILTVEYELSRVPITNASAALILPGGGSAKLFVAIQGNGRRITITRDADSPDELVFPLGGQVELTLSKIGDAPEHVRDVWVDSSRRAELVDGSIFPTDMEVFEARSWHIAQQREAAVAGTPEAKRLTFEAFLVDWDRETFSSEEVAPFWTKVGTRGALLEGPERVARKDAVDTLGVTLFNRAKARGQDLNPDSYKELEVDSEQLTLIGELHERLFARHFGELNKDSLADLGRQFLGFATGSFGRTVETKGGAYQNGRPNGAILVTLPELSSLLSADPERAKYWSDLHLWFVGCIAGYGKSHYYSSEAMMGDYGLGSLVPDRCAKESEESALANHLAQFQTGNELDLHWRNLLHLLAPGSFDPCDEAVARGFVALGDYFRPPSA